MNADLTKTILITGTSRGIGKFLALHYHKLGYNVIGCSRAQLHEEIGRNYHHFSVDITNEIQVIEMFSEIKSNFSALDYLINSAGINTANSLSILTSVKSATETLNTNLLGTFLITREAVKLMIRNHFGRIINLGSMATKHEVEGEAIYTASKGGVYSMTRVIAKELNSFGITCNVISPAAIDTTLMKQVDALKFKLVLKRNAIQSIGSLEDIAHLTDFLLSNKSSCITGQNIFLGGA